eukprot:CFRG6963T1
MSHINEQKLKAFQVGRMNISQKKTPYELEKERKERKKKEEEEAAARVFEEFVENFKQGDKEGSKTFVRGSTINPSSVYDPAQSEGSSSSTGGRQLYTLAAKSSTSIPANKNEGEPSAPAPVPGKKKKEPKKMSNLELFKEQLKKEQEERETRKAMKSLSGAQGGKSSGLVGAVGPSGAKMDEEKNNYASWGSRPDGDPTTTNIYVGNLSGTANEEMLCRIFGKYGPLASVKIMWPLSAEERARGRNPAFVAFMERKHAQEAMYSLHNTEIEGNRITMGWGKAMPVPPVPFYVHTKEAELAITASGLPFNAQLRKRYPENSTGSKSTGSGKYTNVGVPTSLLIDSNFSGGSESHEQDRDTTNKTTGNDLEDAEVVVMIPEDTSLRKRIHRMVQYVTVYGTDFESLIMQREYQNPDYEFLYEYNSKEHVYYRWKLFTILQGEKPDDWSKSRFKMYKDGSWWLPPSKALEEETVKGQLKGKDRDTLEEYLRSAELNNNYVKNVMGFCLEHSAAAEEIVEVLTDSLSIPQTPIPTKIARLYVISDVLHNTSVAGASFFRSSFESQLPGIMSHMNVALNSISGRMRAEYFKKRVLGVIGAWESWSLYPFTFLHNLKQKFLYIPPRLGEGDEQNQEGEEGTRISDDNSNTERTSSDMRGAEKAGGKFLSSCQPIDASPVGDSSRTEPQQTQQSPPLRPGFKKAGFKPIGFRPIGEADVSVKSESKREGEDHVNESTDNSAPKKARIQSKWE